MRVPASKMPNMAVKRDAPKAARPFESIGIPMPGTVDTDDQALGEDMVVIYVGAKY